MNETRSFTDMAIKWGRAHQSPQTKFLHYFNHANGEHHDTIPLIENALFTLSLLQTKTTENILEGKSLLEAILHFQNDSLELNKGNFPIYLHDYPQCRDRYLGLRLFPALYWIYKYFHQILGADLKARLEKACLLIVQHAQQLYHENSHFPYEIALRLAAATQAWGNTLKDLELIKSGQAIENELLSTLNTNFPETFYSPVALADIIVSLQLIYPSIKNSPWQSFWNYIEKTWNRATCSYCGPSLREFQNEYEPETTLYDLFCSYFSGLNSKRAQQSNHSHIQAILIRPVEERFEEIAYSLEVEGHFSNGEKWLFQQNQNYSLSILEEITARPSNEKGIHLLKLIWGNLEQTHSLVSQIKAQQQFTFKKQKNGFDLFFELTGQVNPDERDKGKEISFFLDLLSKPRFTISQIPTNTFQCGETVLLETEELSFEVCFSIEKGNGQFFGHMMRGNRPSQIAVKGANRFNAYDSEFFLRTIHRSNPCTIKMALRII